MGSEANATHRPTLADIIAGRHVLEPRAVGECEGSSLFSHASATNSIKSSGVIDKDVGSSLCSKTEEFDSHLFGGRALPNNCGSLNRMQMERLQTIFAEESGVRRDNIRRLLERLGLQFIPDDVTLESYFEANGDAKSSLSLAQWISLVAHLFSGAESGSGSIGEESSSLPTLKLDNSETKSDCFVSSKGMFYSRRNSQTQLEENQINTPNVSTVRHTTSTVSCEHLGNSGSRWLTGSEGVKVALVNLFIHCGARDRKGRGLRLYMRDFERMVGLRRNILPPRRIVMDASSTMCKWCATDAGSSRSTNDSLYLDLPLFLALLKYEVGCLVNGSGEGGGVAQPSLPTFCMVLAAIAPAQLQRLCNKDIVQLLCDPETKERVSKALETTGSHAVCHTALFPHQEKGNGGIPTAPSPTLPPRNVTQQSHTQSPLLLSSLGGYLSLDPTLPGAGGDGEKRRPHDPSTTTSRSSGGTAMARRRAGAPRYMEVKPLDEISAAVIARSKARRLVDGLRRNTIPINRYECFARIEYLQKSIFEELNMSDDNDDADADDDDDDDDDIGQGKATSEGESRAKRFIHFKVRPPDVSGPLLPGMHRMGGLGRTQSCRARQETFERLYRSRFRCLNNYNNPPRRQSQSFSMDSQSPLQNQAEKDARPPRAFTSLNTPVSRTSDRQEQECTRQGRSASGTVAQQQNSRPPLMLADLYATRFFPYATGSRCTSRSSSVNPAAATATAATTNGG